MSSNLKINNFDFLRLIAATQVVFGHACAHLHLSLSYITSIQAFISYFPGVPIFFVISGFLISASYERNPFHRSYFTNRFLRIYPALWIAFIFSIFCVAATGYLSHSSVTFSSFVEWMTAQLSIAQFYNPDFMRSFGVGVLNGSLWTISVELQFYLFIPLLYFFLNKLSHRKSNYFLGGTIGLFTFLSLISHLQIFMVIHKLISVTLIPYLYIFLLGIFCQRNMAWIINIVENKFLYYFFGYCLACCLLGNYIQIGTNTPPFIMMLALLFVILSFAFSFKKLSNILYGNDISYGIYIYHMIIINLFVQYHYVRHPIELLDVYVLTILMALLSWFFIEKPALRLKRCAFKHSQHLSVENRETENLKVI